MKGVSTTPNRFNGSEDFTILRLRKAGYSWSQIAAELPGRSLGAVQERHRRLTQGKGFEPQPQPPAAIAVDTVEPYAFEYQCVTLLRRQLETGQFNGAARAAWLARHENAGAA